MIQISDLSVCYGDLRAVDGLSLSVPAGSMYGLLGPNGAGKTTTISCVSGLITPNGGSITVDGVEVTADIARARQLLGVVPQQLALYDDLTVIDNLATLGARTYR